LALFLVDFVFDPFDDAATLRLTATVPPALFFLAEVLAGFFFVDGFFFGTPRFFFKPNFFFDDAAFDFLPVVAFFLPAVAFFFVAFFLVPPFFDIFDVLFFRLRFFAAAAADAFFFFFFAAAVAEAGLRMVACNASQE
jgi:hypothetical protein